MGAARAATDTEAGTLLCACGAARGTGLLSLSKIKQQGLRKVMFLSDSQWNSWECTEPPCWEAKGGGFFCGRRPLPFGGSHLRFPSGPAFFSLWFGRKCTRLGPYKCVSSENLRNRTRMVREKGKSVHKPTSTKNQPTKRPANPPARFAFRRKSNSKTTPERGKAQPQQPLDLPSDTVPLQQYHFQKHTKLISNCGTSSVLLHARLQ